VSEIAKPAGGTGGPRQEIAISHWKAYEKNSLKGFFSASFPSGLIIHSLQLHERNGARWVGVPSRRWTDERGEEQHSRLIEFTTRAAAERFRDSLLLALDAFLAADTKPISTERRVSPGDAS
jgi:DNA-binding cell septation regulator SpoVG